MSRPVLASSRGVALIAVLLVASLVFVVGVGLALMLTIGQLVARNHREAAVLVAAADGAVDLVADSLGTADWAAVLAGAEVAPQSDGAPAGVRRVEGGVVDLAAETNRQNCGRTASCSDGDRRALTVERPWGANNPFWQLYLFGPLASFGAFRFAPGVYLLAWIADDGRETDGRPDIDGGAPPGRHILRARVAAIGREGGRRIVDAELVRVCLEGRSACEPGIRVQSQREIRHVLP
jgi:hypothetical protein